MTRRIYPDIEAVFIDTGLEYPEIKKFVKTFDNLTILRPEMSFNQVVEKYGYPIISKEQAGWIKDYQRGGTEKMRSRINKVSKKWRYLGDAPFRISDECCNVLKKKPIKIYEKISGKHPIIGTLAAESRKRIQDYLKTGCNIFCAKRPISKPLSFWTEQDILTYLRRFDIPYCSIYGDIVDTGEQLVTTGVERTGCMFCMFGVHLDKEPNRFQKMATTHPKLYDYCINKLGCGKVLNYIGVNYKPTNLAIR